MHSRIHLLSRLIILSGALAACSTPTAPTSNGQGATQNNQYHVAIVPPGMTSPFHVSIAEGAKAEGAKLGWKVEVQATASESDTEGQVILVQQLLEMGTQAISINSLQSDAIVPAVKAANAKNVPIFIHNSLTPLSDGVVTAYIGYDQWRGAAKLGEYMCKLLAKKFNI